MINSKQRAYLKSLANNIKPSFQVGKQGLTDSLIEELDAQLEYSELIKISVLDNSPADVGDIADEILEKTQSQFVQMIGGKLIIYRESKKHKKIEL